MSKPTLSSSDASRHSSRDSQGASSPSSIGATQITGWPALVRLSWFLLILALLIVGTHWGISAGLRSITTGGYGATNRVVRGKVNAELVVSGSSRALVHFDSRVLEEATGLSTFNIGRNGAQTDMQLAALRLYLQHNDAPRLVVHNLDLFSFKTSRGIADVSQYLPYLGEESIYAGIRRAYPQAWKLKHLPLYGYVAEDMGFQWVYGLLALAGIEPRETRFQGFEPRHLQWTDAFENFRRSNPEGVYETLEEQGVRDLIELVEICKQRGIALLFVYSPEYHEVHALQRNRSEVFDKFKEIGERYDVPLWDYSLSSFAMKQSNFYNSQHLNAEAASAFSADLAARIRDSIATLTDGSRGSYHYLLVAD